MFYHLWPYPRVEIEAMLQRLTVSQNLDEALARRGFAIAWQVRRLRKLLDGYQNEP